MDLTLVRGRTVLARITGAEPDQPWFEADFAPTVEFDSVRPMFDRASELLEREEWAEWEQAWSEIRQAGIRLRSADEANEIAAFALYVDGDRCRFRY